MHTLAAPRRARKRTKGHPALHGRKGKNGAQYSHSSSVSDVIGHGNHNARIENTRNRVWQATG